MDEGFTERLVYSDSEEELGVEVDKQNIDDSTNEESNKKSALFIFFLVALFIFFLVALFIFFLFCILNWQ